jgi:hypothetical protein
MNETNQKDVQTNQKAVEAKTVLNGQEVNVKEAQAAEEAFEAQNNQTGVQAHHDNSSEAVQAGQVAQNATGQNMQQQQKAAVKQSEMQSGQQHLSQHIQNAGTSQVQQAAKEDHEMMQKAVDAKAKTKKAD